MTESPRGLTARQASNCPLSNSEPCKTPPVVCLGHQHLVHAMSNGIQLDERARGAIRWRMAHVRVIRQQAGNFDEQSYDDRQ